jgi:hypothetical protein
MLRGGKKIHGFAGNHQAERTEEFKAENGEGRSAENAERSGNKQGSRCVP